MMIKLIVTDMDGCFLNDKKQLHPDTFSLINQCSEQGIHFAVASGRSYPSLSSLFHPILDQITLICDNGSYISHKNNPLHLQPLEKEHVHFFIKEGLKDPNAYTVLCSPTQSYMKKTNHISQRNMDEILHYCPNIKLVDDLLTIEEDIIKITFLDPRGAEKNIYQQLKPFHGNPSVILSAQLWVDIINPSVNKGMGVQTLQKHLGISSQATIVFGDYLNDLEMIQEAEHSFAPSNAHPTIQTHAKTIIGNHRDWSVFEKIKEIITE